MDEHGEFHYRLSVSELPICFTHVDGLSHQTESSVLTGSTLR